MNSKSENAVQNINSDTTSEERSQAHSPVVISRRRLLRAGVSGIPILLTMHGLAPAEGTIKGAPSAASAMNYDKQGTYQRMYDYRTGDVVLSDENGFIIKPDGNKEEDYKYLNIEPVTDSVSLPLNGATGEGADSKTVQVLGKTLGYSNCYLHKSGNWYADTTISDENDYSLSSPDADTQNYLKSQIEMLFDDSVDVTVTNLSISLVNNDANLVSGSDYNGGTNYYYKIGEDLDSLAEDKKIANVVATVNLSYTETVMEQDTSTDPPTQVPTQKTYKKDGATLNFDILLSDSPLIIGSAGGMIDEGDEEEP